MANSIPLIRALSTLPALRWLMVNGYSTEEILRKADLSTLQTVNPMQPIPLVLVGRMLHEIGDRHGPDAPARIVAEANILEIALLGRIALGTRSPREALTRITAAIPLFCSHEHLAADRGDNETIVRQFYTQRFDSRTQHLFHQYVATMLDRLCAMAGAQYPRLARIDLMPDPEFGLEHLRKYFGDNLNETRSRTVVVAVKNEILDMPFRLIARDRMAGARPSDLEPLRGDGTLAGSARKLLLSMIDFGEPPTIKRLAASAGRSIRTVQRQLNSENHTFSELLEEVRREEAMKRLAGHDVTLASISADIGYADQASLTRAFRRWAGEPPSQFRARSVS